MNELRVLLALLNPFAALGETPPCRDTGKDVPCKPGTGCAESILPARRKTDGATRALRHRHHSGIAIKPILLFKGVYAMKRPLFRNRRDSKRYLAATTIVFCAVLLADSPFGGKALSQNEKDKPPAVVAARPDDVKSIDAIIAALYDVISGPAGERDWDRLRSLFYSEARLIPCVRATQEEAKPPNTARVLTVEDYIKRAEPRFKVNGFFEREIARRVERFGAVAHVFSTYESRHAANDPQPFARDQQHPALFRWHEVVERNDLLGQRATRSSNSGRVLAEKMTTGAPDCNPERLRGDRFCPWQNCQCRGGCASGARRSRPLRGLSRAPSPTTGAHPGRASRYLFHRHWRISWKRRRC